MIAQKTGECDRQHEEGQEGGKSEHGQIALQHEDLLQDEAQGITKEDGR